MQTITRGRTVDYTFKRWGDADPVTRPAVVTAVVEAKRQKTRDPMRPASSAREYELVTAVTLVVHDELGIRLVDQPVFEDEVCEGGAPALGCWGWPAHEASAPAPAADKNGGKKKR